MRKKLAKRLKVNKQLQKNIERWVEYFARLVVLASVIVMAILTVRNVLPLLPESIHFRLVIFLFLFIIAASIVFYFEVRHLFRRQLSNQQGNIRIPADAEHSSRNRWLSIGLLVVAAVVLIAIFVPRQLQLDAQGYQVFYTAFAATGAWVTGIALAVFAYQQYRLRQTEHSLLFNPQLLLSSSVPIAGEAVYNNQKYPYRIEWAVFIQNTSSVPIIIEHMAVKVRSARGDFGREEYIPYDCYFILEPDGLEPPFQVTLAAPQRIKYIIAGRDMGQVLDYVAGDGKSRVFELTFKVRAKTPQSQGAPLIMETFSAPFIIPENAKWGDYTAILT